MTALSGPIPKVFMEPAASGESSSVIPDPELSGNLPPEGEDAQAAPPEEVPEPDGETFNEASSVLPEPEEEEASSSPASGVDNGEENNSENPEISEDGSSGEESGSPSSDSGFEELPDEVSADGLSSENGDLYALVLEGFQVTGELIMIQTGLLAVLLAFFVFRFVFHLISNMVTKYL